jgi:replicative DNA helicase
MNDQFRETPSAIYAERRVLGGMILDNSTIEYVFDCLNEDDFYNRDHRDIFAAIRYTDSRKITVDAVSISDHLTELSTFIFELINEVPSAANIKAYCSIIKDRSQLRKVLKTCNKISESVYNIGESPISEILDNAEKDILSISKDHKAGADSAISIKNLVASALNSMDTVSAGLFTGFNQLDKITSGFQGGDLIIVGARPAQGKTSFSMNIAENVALNSSKPVIVFSMEMSAEALTTRMISSIGMIDQRKIRTKTMDEAEWSRSADASAKLSERPLFIDDSAALTPIEMRSRARRLEKVHGQLGLIVVDYLQLMRVPDMRSNRVQEVSEISRSLKALAKEMNCPVIAISQLNRGLESREDKRPNMSDLRDSGGLEQDSDLILFVYRDEVYRPNVENKGKAEIIVAKHRNGETGVIHLRFQGQYTRFSDYG